MKRTAPIFRVSIVLLSMAALAGDVSAQGQDQDGPGTNPNPEAIRTARQLQDRYDSLTSMSARFVHTMTSEFLDTNERTSGTLVFLNEKYRVETGAQTIVTDGVVTWVHNRAERQVLINDYDEDESTFSLTEILQAFDREYDPVSVESVRVDGEDHRILDLEPRDLLSDYLAVRLWIRSRDGLVTRMRLVDLNEAVLEFDLDGIIFNPDVEPSTFTFDAPEGVEVVDLRN